MLENLGSLSFILPGSDVEAAVVQWLFPTVVSWHQYSGKLEGIMRGNGLLG